jgi:hypothetical protein
MIARRAALLATTVAALGAATPGAVARSAPDGTGTEVGGTVPSYLGWPRNRAAR